VRNRTPCTSRDYTIHVSEQGNSVWASLAKPDTAEYQTDVYGDELTIAESLAQGVMQGNLLLKDTEPKAGQPIGREADEKTDQKAGKDHKKRLPESPSSAPLHRHEPFTPKSYVPPRSPDLGELYFPLSPSIGPGSGLLGPEAGRSPARLRSGDETGRGLETGSDGR
jgi:membrane fusion protein (multidrug efflux system)